MILDTGVCGVYTVSNTAAPGEKPNETLALLSQMWYGELDFETNPVFETEDQESTDVSARIRVLQDRRISRANIVILADGQQYKVERAFHGRDKENGELITDLNLSKVVDAYG